MIKVSIFRYHSRHLSSNLQKLLKTMLAGPTISLDYQTKRPSSLSIDVFDVPTPNRQTNNKKSWHTLVKDYFQGPRQKTLFEWAGATIVKSDI